MVGTFCFYVLAFLRAMMPVVYVEIRLPFETCSLISSHLISSHLISSHLISSHLISSRRVSGSTSVLIPILLLLSCAPKPLPPPPVGPAMGVVVRERGDVASLPDGDTRISRIAFGSCADQKIPMPVLSALLGAKPDLFVFLGDNVYGDARAGDASLPELRSAYGDLARHTDFRNLIRTVPVLSVWDDHDFADNDGGASFAFKEKSESIFEQFWADSPTDPRNERPGVYSSWNLGPEGERIQFLLLDTRFFRSELTRKRKGQFMKSGRYVESKADEQDMLGEAQWQWLESQLNQPADVRIVVSSIQVLAEKHGWERWGLLPKERTRLLNLLHTKDNVVIVSGDRHWASTYRDETGLTELTTSAINRPSKYRFTETGPLQFSRPYVDANYGEITIDWEKRTMQMSILDVAGNSVVQIPVDFK
jgi:alkaline phosphatase D